ncbi:hypothetical protein GCM10027579_01110 [Calidifontibacter terrae]
MGSSDPLDLGPAGRAELLGRLSWSDYFDVLRRGQVLLSLQATPHPSHPPLDMVLAGGISVTNELRGTRGELHPRLHAVDPDPESLAMAVVQALEAGRDSAEDAVSTQHMVESLGTPFESAVRAVLATL